ncbi:MAG: serine/threonine-protein kinase, partial [Chloroflexota bacterium]
MATVYLAYDPKVKREVAVKVLPLEFTHDPTFRTRFQREGHTVGKIQSAYIVPVYDIGEESKNGQPYLVMQYMPGGSLADLIKPGGMGLEASKPIIERIARALDDAHAQGVIHRDLKPANFLFDKNGNVFLADFGIVKLATENHTLTGTQILGTPAYMSPEQARGTVELDHRSDIYALGAILFEMLSGRTPYEADTPLGQAIAQVNEPIPRVTEHNPHLPPAIDDLIARSMAKNREDRFDSATELFEDLDLVHISPSRLVNIADLPPQAEPFAPVLPQVDGESGENGSSVNGSRPSDEHAAEADLENSAPFPLPSWVTGWGGIAAFVSIVVTLLIIFGGQSFGSASAGDPTALPTSDAIAAAVVETDTPTPTETLTPEPPSTLTLEPTEEPKEEIKANISLSSTAEATSTPTPSVTSEPTHTSTPTLTPTPDIPVFETLFSSNIRLGPGRTYDQIWGVDAGASLVILGASPDLRWLKVEFESTIPNKNGWISIATGDVSVPIEEIEIIENIPPSPTPTPTSTP